MKRPGPNPLLLLVNCTCCGNGYKHVDQDSLVRRKGTAYTDDLQGPFEQTFGVSRIPWQGLVDQDSWVHFGTTVFLSSRSE